MLAALCRAYGDPSTVTVEQWPVPEVGPGQVRVAVRAAAVNFPDVLLVADRYQLHVPVPFVPGSELAGSVVEVAGDVTGVAVGDRVSASTMVGAFAEQAVVSAAGVVPIPPGISDEVAAAYGVGHRTAYHALRSMAAVQAGEELVVLGAGGGVGLAAVQLGTVLGATVTAVASSPAKLRAAVDAGARRVIDRTTVPDLRQALRTELPDGADVVLDPVGGDLSEPALRTLRWGGRFVTVGYASGVIPRIPLNLVLLKGARILGFQLRDFATNEPEHLARDHTELMGLLADGRAVPHVGARFALADVSEALALVAEGQAVGKVVVTMP